MSSPRTHSTAFRAMGTVATASWSAPETSTLQVDSIKEVLKSRSDELENLMSRFISNSEVAQLGTEWARVSLDTAAVLRAARDYSEITLGYFNPLMGVRMRHWDRVAKNAESSGDTGSSRAIPDSKPSWASSMGELSIEQDGLLFRLKGADSGSVDLGAIAKGYAADELRSSLVGMGLTDVLVSMGDSSIAIAGAPTQVGITSPWHRWERIGTLTLDFGSMSMSADPDTVIQPPERTLSDAVSPQPSRPSLGTAGVPPRKDARPRRQRSHVLNPRTGDPALTDLCGVIVCGVDGMACEAFSTAYLAMGLDAALVMDQEHPEIATMFFTVDGRMLADPRLKITTIPGLAAWLKTQREA